MWRCYKCVIVYPRRSSWGKNEAKHTSFLSFLALKAWAQASSFNYSTWWMEKSDQSASRIHQDWIRQEPRHRRYRQLLSCSRLLWMLPLQILHVRSKQWKIQGNCYRPLKFNLHGIETRWLSLVVRLIVLQKNDRVVLRLLATIMWLCYRYFQSGILWWSSWV